MMRSPNPEESARVRLIVERAEVDEPSGHLFGRVVDSNHDAIKVVYLVGYQDHATKIFRPPFPSSLKTIKAGQAVLLQKYKNSEIKHIMNVSTTMEMDLFAKGFLFPEPPPELYPGGYYG